MIDKVFIRLLSGVDPKQLDKLITRDISLVNKYYLEDPNTRFKIDTFMKPFLPVLKISKDDFNVDSLLNKIYEGNPQVHEIITQHPNGIMWLCVQAEEIGKQLLIEKQKKGLLRSFLS